MKKIVCHGDSLTEAADIDQKDRWPALIEDRLNVHVINSGIGGDTSGGLLARFNTDVVRHNPDFAIIMAGTNDLWWDLDTNIIQANIFAMVCQAQYHKIEPIVGLPLPLDMKAVMTQDFLAPVGGYERCLRKLTELNRALVTSAKASDIRFLDFSRSFLDTEGSVLTEYYLEDGLHPNKKGHRRIAETAVEQLQKLIPI